MSYVFSQITKYIITVLMILYTINSFLVFFYRNDKERKGLYAAQVGIRILIHFLAYMTLFFLDFEYKFIILFLLQEILFITVTIAYKRIYKYSSKLVINNMFLLLTIGLIILTRLSYQKSIRQFIIITVSLIVTFAFPYIIEKFRYFSKFKWVYTILGIVSLLVVLLFSVSVYGSKLNITIANYTFQPSEYVKIIFVFAIACILYYEPDFKDVIISAIIAAIHVLLLVFSKDLGSAVIYFIVYFSMLYVATKKYLYVIIGILGGAISSIAGYFLFAHVRNRIIAFTDPFGTIDNAGYQIAQSLFAIGTGGWFGMGLGQGAPNTIPVVSADFIFSALVEELGVIFGICLILVCFNCFMMFLLISTRINDSFFKLVSLGLSVEYGFQVFLTIGGVTKFIPLTGVTLPLVSYGGTSIVTTLTMFSIIQGLYITRGEATHKNTNIDLPNDNSVDEEEIMFEKAVNEGIRIANDDPELFEIGKIDDFI